MIRYLAHTKNAQGKRHDLIQHLRTVANMAAGYGSAFGAGELARYIGLWHDVGKFNPQFQEYLMRCEANPSAKGRGPDHKAAGSQIALRHLQLLAMLIQGHHGGLDSPTGFQGWLAKKTGADDTRAIDAAIATACAQISGLEPNGELPLPPHIANDPAAAELFLRLLFSALVDADYLDTEAHFNVERVGIRGSNVSMEGLWSRFEQSMTLVQGRGSPKVAQARAEILEACLSSAELPPGLFRLTVPTGGGKTRSGMAFALRHTLRYGQRRVIVAVPFISITEQTAQTYRDIFHVGKDEDAERPIVLEHHSSADRQIDEEDFHPPEEWSKLSSENWDAPIVVTTTVQLFESLFDNSTSKCRKLHRLADSVIILDEAQALPPHLLRPILDALRQLCLHYGTTIVISTATQPAFDTIPDFREFGGREIVPNPARYFRDLKRVEYEWLTNSGMSWEAVAERMGQERQALAIVNTKKDAMALLDALAASGAGTTVGLFHLSTLLCGAHRRNVIEEVRGRLRNGEPCLLVSTQVIEAGVDLDFPFVMRALGPLDGIIQAAGRCNREGKLSSGRMIVFRPAEGGMPKGAYHTGASITQTLLHSGNRDPDDPRYARLYFQQLFNTINIDREEIQMARQRLNYPEVAHLFKMIDDDTESVVVRYGSA
ncbi:MAG TPA: CRISPR-associated helicase Cas3', partial [Chloroflexia bacterium]|nr:CRISPR-associated helicase Cas3' [Chloroflexia bacterium]